MAETHITKQIISSRGIIDTEGTPRGVLFGADGSIISILGESPGTEIGSVGIIDASGRRATIDTITHALNVIDYAHHEIHSGSNYRVQAYDDGIANNGELVIGLYVPAGTKLPHIIWEFIHQGDMTMKVLEDVTLTLGTGTDRACKNSRRDAGDSSILQGVSTGALVAGYVTENPTYSGGTVVSIKRNYAAKNEAAGGNRRQEIILKADAYYAFVLENIETSAQGGQIRLEWYEHTDKT